MTFTWTPDVIEQMKALFSEGKSAAETGAILGCSRNAVIGKWHRLGMSVAAKPRKPRVPRPPKPKKPRNAFGKFDLPLFVVGTDPKELIREYRATQAFSGFQHRPLLDLKHYECRYPEGEGASITFCGCIALPGFSYCEPHKRITSSVTMSPEELMLMRQAYRRNRVAA